jgi:hypothetical protein
MRRKFCTNFLLAVYVIKLPPSLLREPGTPYRVRWLTRPLYARLELLLLQYW